MNFLGTATGHNGAAPSDSVITNKLFWVLHIRRRIEVVITGRTRNAFALTGTWVRIPPSPPKTKCTLWSAFCFLRWDEKRNTACHDRREREAGETVRGTVSLLRRESHRLRQKQNALFGASVIKKFSTIRLPCARYSPLNGEMSRSDRGERLR